jgi:hypothetical protein
VEAEQQHDASFEPPSAIKKKVHFIPAMDMQIDSKGKTAEYSGEVFDVHTYEQ